MNALAPLSLNWLALANREIAAEIEVAADALMQSGIGLDQLSIIRHIGAEHSDLGWPLGLAVDGREVFRVSWRRHPDRPLTWLLCPIWLRPIGPTTMSSVSH